MSPETIAKAWPHLAVGQLESACVSEHCLMVGLVEACPTGDVGARVGQTQTRALQCGVYRVGERWVICLWVVGIHCIHPTLHPNNRESTLEFTSEHRNSKAFPVKIGTRYSELLVSRLELADHSRERRRTSSFHQLQERHS